MNNEVRNTFDRLFKEWDELIHSTPLSFSSIPQDYVNTEPCKQMIELGNDALPFFIEKIEGGQFLLNNAIFQITGLKRKDLPKGKNVRSEQEISELLVKWWNDNKQNYHVKD